MVNDLIKAVEKVDGKERRAAMKAKAQAERWDAAKKKKWEQQEAKRVLQLEKEAERCARRNSNSRFQPRCFVRAGVPTLSSAGHYAAQARERRQTPAGEEQRAEGAESEGRGSQGGDHPHDMRVRRSRAGAKETPRLHCLSL